MKSNNPQYVNFNYINQSQSIQHEHEKANLASRNTVNSIESYTDDFGTMHFSIAPQLKRHNREPKKELYGSHSNRSAATQNFQYNMPEVNTVPPHEQPTTSYAPQSYPVQLQHMYIPFNFAYVQPATPHAGFIVSFWQPTQSSPSGGPEHQLTPGPSTSNITEDDSTPTSHTDNVERINLQTELIDTAKPQCAASYLVQDNQINPEATLIAEHDSTPMSHSDNVEQINLQTEQLDTTKRKFAAPFESVPAASTTEVISPKKSILETEFEKLDLSENNFPTLSKSAQENTHVEEAEEPFSELFSKSKVSLPSQSISKDACLLSKAKTEKTDKLTPSVQKIEIAPKNIQIEQTESKAHAKIVDIVDTNLVTRQKLTRHQRKLEKKSQQRMLKKQSIPRENVVDCPVEVTVEVVEHTDKIMAEENEVVHAKQYKEAVDEQSASKASASFVKAAGTEQLTRRQKKWMHNQQLREEEKKLKAEKKRANELIAREKAQAEQDAMASTTSPKMSTNDETMAETYEKPEGLENKTNDFPWDTFFYQAAMMMARLPLTALRLDDEKKVDFSCFDPTGLTQESINYWAQKPTKVWTSAASLNRFKNAIQKRIAIYDAKKETNPILKKLVSFFEAMLGMPTIYMMQDMDYIEEQKLNEPEREIIDWKLLKMFETVSAIFIEGSTPDNWPKLSHLRKSEYKTEPKYLENLSNYIRKQAKLRSKISVITDDHTFDSTLERLMYNSALDPFASSNEVWSKQKTKEYIADLLLSFTKSELCPIHSQIMRLYQFLFSVDSSVIEIDSFVLFHKFKVDPKRCSDARHFMIARLWFGYELRSSRS